MASAPRMAQAESVSGRAMTMGNSLRADAGRPGVHRVWIGHRRLQGWKDRVGICRWVCRGRGVCGRAGGERVRHDVEMEGLARVELAVSFAGLEGAAPGGVRERLEWAAGLGAKWVVLDGAAPGVRARELSRSARRDLGAMMRRAGLRCAGIDLWIPTRHLMDERHVDRAVGALVDASGLAGELAALTEGRAVVCCNLPREGEAEQVVGTIADDAARRGAVIADCAWPSRRDAGAVPGLGVGIDAATVLLAGEDPGRAVSRMGSAVACVRLSDADGSGRSPVGRGRLDRLGYEVAMVTAGVDGPMVIDSRGVRDGAGMVSRLLSDEGGSPF